MRLIPTILMTVASALALSGLCTPALAADDQAVLTLTAVVKPFCRISHDAEADHALLVDGAATLGSVREVCNTPNGYQVHARFINLDSGTLMAGAEALPISADGAVAFQFPSARSIVREWRIVDAVQPVAANIYMRVSISPI